jgi:hypothetical protein
VRTTLTVDDDLDARLRKVAREQNRPYKDVLNQALAHGIEALEVAEPQELYQVESAAFGFKLGIDPGRLNELYDELGATLASTDTDFARFSGLTWINPIS